ncbi:hypothetical protein K488DRAFT_71831 [Vararia minispora EC-137]|uniref:Uncharacterized protein n=1 Tax=Vararia minispora EC-137 TaxID=1314806 RepID=A0ACB8QH23_9AGAM|nr:hypothetical protein K488DRAFT_71831 [Vararia minispora EC-137]
MDYSWTDIHAPAPSIQGAPLPPPEDVAALFSGFESADLPRGNELGYVRERTHWFSFGTHSQSTLASGGGTQCVPMSFAHFAGKASVQPHLNIENIDAPWYPSATMPLTFASPLPAPHLSVPLSDPVPPPTEDLYSFMPPIPATHPVTLFPDLFSPPTGDFLNFACTEPATSSTLFSPEPQWAERVDFLAASCSDTHPWLPTTQRAHERRWRKKLVEKAGVKSRSRRPANRPLKDIQLSGDKSSPALTRITQDMGREAVKVLKAWIAKNPTSESFAWLAPLGNGDRKVVQDALRSRTGGERPKDSLTVSALKALEWEEYRYFPVQACQVCGYIGLRHRAGSHSHRKDKPPPKMTVVLVSDFFASKEDFIAGRWRSADDNRPVEEQANLVEG